MTPTVKGARTIVIAALAAAAVAAGCGSSSSSSTSSPAAGTTATTKTAEANGKNAKKGASERTCDNKGINLRQGKTGTCIRNGKVFTLVDKSQRVKVGDVSVQLLKVTTIGSVSGALGKANPGKRGRFVVAKLKVTNQGTKTIVFHRKQNQVRLRVSGQGVPEIFAAETATAGSFVNRNARLKRGETATGSVVFRMPSDKTKVLSARGADGQLLLWEPSNAGKNEPPDAAIRLWQ
jgi:hypothetical protein